MTTAKRGDYVVMSKDENVLLTTKDNEFNPFTQYDDWKNFDEYTKHYCTEAYVARVVAELAFQVRNILEGEVSDDELNQLRNEAYDDIIKYNNEIGYDIYVKIRPDGTKINDAPSLYLEKTSPQQD